MPTSTSTQYVSTDNITIYTEATTIPNSPSPVVNTSVLNCTIQAVFEITKEQFEENSSVLYEQFDK